MIIKTGRMFHFMLAAGLLAAMLLIAPGARLSMASDTSTQQVGCNPSIDADCDEVPDSIDNCKYFYNPNQANNDAALETPPYVFGDVCDPDDDNDGTLDSQGQGVTCPSSDTCMAGKTCSVSRTSCTTNTDCNAPSQRDTCMPQLQYCLRTGGFCQSDADCPIITDVCGNRCQASNAACTIGNDQCFLTGCDDNCQFVSNPGQLDGDGDGAGDACDNCIAIPNPSQANADQDSLGDACDPDIDGDTFQQDPSISPVCSVVPDNNGNPPGPPNNTCRDNCAFIFNSSQWDHDRDLVGTACDNCIATYNPSQLDTDVDSVGNACDNCSAVSNSSQTNMDTDALGDSCDNCKNVDNNLQTDTDFDGIGNQCDLCPIDFDPGQPDSDGDGRGDACDPCPVGGADFDGDGVCDTTDNCVAVSNANQSDVDGDGQGDVCDCDRDADGVNDKVRRVFVSGGVAVTQACFSDPVCEFIISLTPSPACNRTGGLTPPCCIDNCPDTSNSGQANNDGDDEGNVCDATPVVSEPGPSSHFDSDGDSRADAVDNCARTFNPNQADLDLDTVGDLCDADADGDGLSDSIDNCRMLANPTQDDADNDRVGDACDNCRFAANSSQEDRDRDAQGDRCDLDDGQISLQLDGPADASWDGELGFDRYITVVGDLATLRSTGVYVQDPATIPVAAVYCEDTGTALDLGGISPAPGQAVFIITGGSTNLIENGFSRASNGSKRIVTRLCP